MHWSSLASRWSFLPALSRGSRGAPKSPNKAPKSPKEAAFWQNFLQIPAHFAVSPRPARLRWGPS